MTPAYGYIRNNKIIKYKFPVWYTEEDNRMKRAEVVSTIAYMIADGYEGYDQALRILSYLEDLGMLPPVCTVTIKDGKHTPTVRKWDDEA